MKGRCALVAGRGPPNGPAGKLVYTGGGARPRAAPPRPRPRGAPPRVGAELLAADEDMSFLLVFLLWFSGLENKQA